MVSDEEVGIFYHCPSPVESRDSILSSMLLYDTAKALGFREQRRAIWSGGRIARQWADIDLRWRPCSESQTSHRLALPPPGLPQAYLEIQMADEVEPGGCISLWHLLAVLSRAKDSLTFTMIVQVHTI